MDVSSHQHTVVCRHSEKGDEADPYGYAQVNGMHLEQVPHIDSRQRKVHEPVLTVQPEQDKAAGKSHEYTGEMNQRGRKGLELEIQNQEDDIMVPMAIPTFGGMLIQSMTMFVVPVFQCWWREGLLKKEEKARNAAENSSPGK